MNPLLVEQATLVIPEPHLLINLVSRRVRQLGSGSRPMIEAGMREGAADVALREIIEGKLSHRPRQEV
jgi:DNA-directed RNA polymerase subunit omega